MLSLLPIVLRDDLLYEGGVVHLRREEIPMTATLTQVVKQFQQDWTGQLEPNAILTACRGVAYRWRERTLDPVTTIQLFFVQSC